MTATPTERPATGQPAGFRPELHGVRGLALTLVVVFHVLGNGRISGGIDVFLTITGFLITGSLLRRVVAGGGRLDVKAHYGRLAQRLLPPLLVVCSAVAVAASILLPSTHWLQTARELTASVLYFENWELIASQLSYDAAGPATSPLQHIWSLSIQGQFHLIWPFVVLGAVALAPRLRRRPGVVLGVILALIVVASFGYAVYATGQDQQVAYFNTATRLWQPALGGLAALVLPTLRFSRRTRIALGWSGLLLIGSCGLVLDGAALFPGPAALWPVLGLVFVLAGGATGSSLGADRLLGSRPLHFVGDISYALYLWHWPVLIFYLVAAEQDRVGPAGAAVILTISVALAWLTRRLVEDRAGPSPDRRLDRRRVRAVLAASVAVVLAFGAANAVLTIRRNQAVAELANAPDPAHPGAAALVAGQPLPAPGTLLNPATVVPSLEAIGQDQPQIYREGCIQNGQEGAEHSAVRVCEDDDVAAPRATVVMSGGSHVMQWWPALEVIAAENEWELLVIDKSGCRLTADRDESGGMEHYESCYQWNELAFDVIVDRHPDYVFTLGSTTKTLEELVYDGMVDVWADLGRRGIGVLAIRDTTRFRGLVPDCLATEGFAPIECGQPRTEVLSRSFPLTDDAPDNVRFVDMTPYVCTDRVCPAIIGGVIVYRDSSHISTTYMRTLVPYLEAELRRAAPELFANGTG